ncbi:hypothetical protein FGB62_121g010 [Gracilaria domingensis]|nr:hypothetical protein FGB62_121g010 [Gracilaria domingensis]
MGVRSSSPSTKPGFGVHLSRWKERDEHRRRRKPHGGGRKQRASERQCAWRRGVAGKDPGGNIKQKESRYHSQLVSRRILAMREYNRADGGTQASSGATGQFGDLVILRR